MRIAQIVCVFPPQTAGIGNSVYNLAKILSAQRHEITVFTPNYNNLVAEYNDIFKVRRLRPFFSFGNAAVLPFLGKHLKDFDAVHLHLPFIGASLSVLFHSFFYRKKKFIATYHMDLVGDRVFRKIIFWFYQKFIIPLILRRADKIIVSSYDYAEHSAIAGYFKKYKNKFVEVPFGVDAGQFFPKEKDRDLMEKYFLPPEDRIILFVGGLDRSHYFKGLNILLKSLKIIRDAGQDNVRLMVVGRGEMESDYKDMAHALGVADRVVWNDEAVNQELPAHYNLADVFVLPSTTKSEAFGIVLLEAAACGKPLIASDLPGVRQVAEDCGGETAEPGNAEDLAEKIMRILDDAEKRRSMGEAARLKIEEKYNLEKISKRFIDLYLP